MNEDKTTQLRDINEKVQELIVESLKTSELFYIRGDAINGYKAIKHVFYKIAPFDFKNKAYLIECTNQIDTYLEEIENRGGKPDQRELIQIGQKKVELKLLIEEYFQLIPFCLRELNLYLRVVKRNDDPDEIFSGETFTTNESLLDEKKKKLSKIKVDVFLKNMTPRQVHDVHARLLTYKDNGGLE